MADVVGRAAYELEARTDRLKRDLAGADATVKQQVSGTEAAVAASGGRFSAEMQRNVTRATTAAGAAVGLFVAGSAIEFAKFDDGMRQVFSIMPGISAEAMGSMKRDVLALSKEYGILTDDIVPALATAVGSGIPEENVMDFLRTSAIAAKAGATDTNSAVTALAASINAFKIPVKDAAAVSDSFFKAIDLGVTSFPELAASMSRVSPQAAAMGLSLDDVLAALSAMTLQGTPTAEAVTNISGSLTALQRVTPPMAQALKNLGFATGQAALDALGYQGTMEALRAEADRMGVPLIKLTGRLEGTSAILQLTGQNADVAQSHIAEFGEKAGATAEAFEIMEGGVGGAARKIVANLKAMAIEVGASIEGLVPLFYAFGPLMGRALGAGMGALAGYIILPLTKAIIAAQAPGMAAGTTVGTAIGIAKARAIGLGLAGAQGVATVMSAVLNRLPLQVSMATIAAGTKIGATMGSAMSTALAAGAVIAVAAMADAIYPEVRKLGQGVHAELQKIELPLPDVDWGAPLDWLDSQPWPIGRVGAPDWAGKAREAEVGVQQVADKTRAAYLASGEATSRAIAATTPTLVAAQDAQVKAVAESWNGYQHVAGAAILGASLTIQAEAARMGKLAGKATAEGIAAARQLPVDAWDQLTELLKNAMTPMAEAARLSGRLTSKKLADALKDSRPDVRAQAEYTKQVQLDRLTELVSGSGKLSKKAAGEISEGLKSKNPTIKRNAEDAKVAYLNGLKQYVTNGGKLSKQAAADVEKGLRSKNGQIRDAAEDIRDLAKKPLQSLSGSTYAYGRDTGGEFARGIRSTTSWIKQAAANAVAAAKAILATHSPPGPESPLHLIDVWGENTGKAWADGFERSGSSMADAARRAVANAGDALRAFSPGASPFQLSTIGPALGLIDGRSAFAATMEVRHRHELTADAARALREAGYSAVEVAGELRKGVDASGFLANLEHAANMRGAV
jgi:TP901 family phage tail tape measure protein